MARDGAIRFNLALHLHFADAPPIHAGALLQQRPMFQQESDQWLTANTTSVRMNSFSNSTSLATTMLHDATINVVVRSI